MTSPDGYQVGTAWLQVLPSFDGFHKRMAAKLAGVRGVEVDIEPQLSTKKAAAAMKAMDDRIAKTPIVRQIDLDERAFNAKIATLTAKRDEMVMRIDADISAAEAKISNLKRKQGKTTIDVDAEIAKAQAKIAYLKSRRDSITIQFDVDSDKAEQTLRKLDNDLTRLRNNQSDINIEASDASRAISIVGGLTAALGVLGQVAPAAAAAVATVPVAIFAAAQGFGAIMAGLSGVSEATKALQAIEDEAITSNSAASAKRVANANRVASAQSQLQRALEQADRSAIQGARQVQQAREGLADAQASAALRVEDAERSLASAQSYARDAQEALTRARKDATERLEDLRLAVSGAALDEEAAVLAVERARERLEAARAANMSGMGMTQIELEARQAEQALAEIRERYGDLREEADEANRTGVEGSREVVAAQRQSEEAAYRIADAERELAQTRVDGARQVAKAQERVSEAQQQASWAAADASRQVADAQRAIGEAAQSAGDSGSAAMDKLALTMGKLSPAGQRFALFLQNRVKPALADIGAAAQGEMLPRLEFAFERLLTLSPLVEEAFAQTGAVIGDIAIKGSELVTSGPWRKDFAAIVGRNNRILATMGDAGLSALDAVRHLTIASGPLAESLAGIAEAKLDEFNTWLREMRDSGQLQQWFAEMNVRIQDFFHTVGQLVGGVWDLVQALAPLGKIIMNIVAPVVEFVGAMAESNPVITTVLATLVLLGSGFISFFRTLGGLRQAVSTSVGVYQSMRNAVFGAKQATDDATTSAGRNATATQTMGVAANRSTSLVGRLRSGLENVRNAYNAGSTASSSWATKTSQAVRGVANDLSYRLVPAVARGVNSVDDFAPAARLATDSVRSFGSIGTIGLTQVSRASALGAENLRGMAPAAAGAATAVQRMSSTTTTVLSNMAGAIGGTATAIGRGIGGAVSGVVGALGGPFGLAVIGATVGLGFLAQAQAEAAQKAAEHKAQVQGLTDALVESNGVIDENVKKKVDLLLRDRSLADNANHLGLNVGLMTRAIAEGGDAAKNFEYDLFGVADELAKSKGLPKEFASSLNQMANEIAITGGDARDFEKEIGALAAGYQHSTGATDEQTEAFRNQITEFLDLVGGYKDAKGDFNTAEQEQKDIAAAQDDAASATERHYNNLKKLNDAVLASAQKDLTHRQNLNNLEEAHGRVAEVLADEEHTTEQLTAARLAEEQSALQVISSAGELAYSISTATTEIGKQKDATIAQAQAAADLANKWQGPIPASLQVYMDTLGVAKDATGQYIVKLDEVPGTVPTEAVFSDDAARAKVEEWGSWLKTYMGDLLGQQIPGYTPQPGSGGPTTLGGLLGLPGGAIGAITIPAYASGGIRPMSGKYAQVVPPNTPRLIGDRMHGDEAFIPLNADPRSIAILAEAAQRMGFGLLPLALGALLGMQDGGVNKAGATAAGTGGDAALTVNASAVDVLTLALQELAASALAPLANEVNASTAPALSLLEDHAGVRSVAAVNALAALLPPLRNDFDLTAKAVVGSWQLMTQASGASVNAISGQLAVLRQGVQQTGVAFANTSDMVNAVWSRIREYTAAPVRAALAGPMNAGLISSWNYINSFFNLGRPLGPVPIPFETGGPVPGTGNRDSVLIAAMPGEYILSKGIVKKWGLRNIHAAHEGAKRGGFPGLEGMFTGDESGISKIVPAFASGGPVPEALARANAFGRSMHGKPYIWGGSSEAGTDCSGWMAMLARSLMDVKPYARREWATGMTAGGTPPPRFSKGIDGLFAIGVKSGVHTAGTLAGRNVEAGGAHNFVAFGPPSAGADSSQFPLKFHLDALGGNFVSGGAGGSFDLSGFIRDGFNASYQQLAQYQEAWGANMMAQAGAALVGQATDAAVNWAVANVAPIGTSGDVESWRPLVLQALRMLGLPMEWADITLRRMNQESGGNQFAVNNWDSNAKRGDPSKGLMQVIGSTFRAYRDTRAPDNVFDALANVLASMKYAMSRYGSLPAAYGRAGGYDSGGLLPPGYSNVFNGLKRPEVVLTDNQWNAVATLAAQDNSAGGEFHGNLYLSSGEFLGAVEGVVERANTESGRVLARRIR